LDGRWDAGGVAGHFRQQHGEKIAQRHRLAADSKGEKQARDQHGGGDRETGQGRAGH
jgi:hypothetical protein